MNDDTHARTLREGIRDAEKRPAEERLHEEPADEPALPDAINLERKEPITDAARRREPARRDADA